MLATASYSQHLCPTFSIRIFQSGGLPYLGIVLPSYFLPSSPLSSPMGASSLSHHVTSPSQASLVNNISLNDTGRPIRILRVWSYVGRALCSQLPWTDTTDRPSLDLATTTTYRFVAKCSPSNKNRNNRFHLLGPPSPVSKCFQSH